MRNLLEFNTEATIYITCMYIFYRILLAKKSNFTFNRIYLISGLLFSSILSANLIQLNINTEALKYAHVLKPFVLSSSHISQKIETSLSAFNVVFIIYISIVIILLILLLLRIYNIYQLSFTSEKFKQKNITIIKVNKDISPFSFFNFIFINNSGIDESDKENIIAHEIVHSTQKHSIDVILLELFCTFQWFNPFIWLYKKAVKENHEFLADKSVLLNGISADKYKLSLLSISTGINRLALANSYNQSLTKKRFKMMTKNKMINRNLLFLFFLIPLLSVFLINSFAFNRSAKSVSNLLQADDSVYYMVNEMPVFPGGDAALQGFIATHIVYPEIAKKLNVSATVYITFVIDENGKVINVKVARSASNGMEILKGTEEKPTKYDAAIALDAESVKVIEALQDWKPGKKDGKTVKVNYTAPINYKLD